MFPEHHPVGMLTMFTAVARLIAATMFANMVEYVALYCAFVALFAPAPIVSAVQPMTEKVDDPEVNVHPDISTLTVADAVAAVVAVPSPSCGSAHVRGTAKGKA